MFDRGIRARVDPALDAAGRRLAARGIGADQVTLAGLGVGLFSALAVALGAFWLALVLFALNRLLDGLDGAVARAREKTDAGGFLDIASDFLVYGAVPLAFAVHDPAANGLPAAALLAGFLVNGSAFLAFAILAARRPDLDRPAEAKSFRYLWGLAEGAETIAVFAAMMLFPPLFPALAFGFAALCLLSGAARILHGYRAARA